MAAAPETYRGHAGRLPRRVALAVALAACAHRGPLDAPLPSNVAAPQLRCLGLGPAPTLACWSASATVMDCYAGTVEHAMAWMQRARLCTADVERWARRYAR